MTYGDLMLLLLFSTVQLCPKRLTYQSSTQRFQGQSLGHTRIQSFFSARNPKFIWIRPEVNGGVGLSSSLSPGGQTPGRPGHLTESAEAEVSIVSPSSWPNSAQLLVQWYKTESQAHRKWNDLFWAKGFLGQGQGMKGFGDLNYWPGGHSGIKHWVSWVVQAWCEWSTTTADTSDKTFAINLSRITQYPIMFKSQIHRLLGPEGPLEMTWFITHFQVRKLKPRWAVTCPRSHGPGELG